MFHTVVQQGFFIRWREIVYLFYR